MQPLTLPYAHLNLRRNPFGELAPEERPMRAIVDGRRWAAALAGADRFALQVLGESGRGKTTHLLALRAELPRSTYRHITEGERISARAIATGSPTIIDECQRLPPRARRRVFARGGPLLLGSHEDHGVELARAGYRVDTLYPAESLDRERLAAILAERIEASRRGPGPVPRISEPALDALRARYGTDVRAMEHCLYETFQTLAEIRDVEVFDLD
jgi:hypothetical protein